MQGKSLARELSAYFCGSRADMENPEIVFTLPSKITALRPVSQVLNLVLEIRIRKADIGALFAFIIGENGFVLGRGNITVSKDVNNKVLWYCYGQPLRLLYRNKKGWFRSEKTENHLYIFGLLPDCNRYEIYKAEVDFVGRGGRLLWQKVCQGQCFYLKDWTLRAEAEQKDCEEWPPLATLFENPAFQDKLRPYILGGQVPRKEPKVKEEKSRSLSELLL